jgi:uncharacterized protein (DUF58 family)
MTTVRSFLKKMRPHAAGDERKIFIIFNASGLVFVCFVIAVFMAGRFQNGGGGLPWLLGIALIVAGLTGMIQTNDNLRGIHITKAESDAVPSGSPATISIRVENQSEVMRHALALRIASRHFWKTCWPLDSLQSGESVLLSIPVPAEKRGVYPFPKLMISTVFPMNICFAWKRFNPEGERVVYPQPRGVPLADVFAVRGFDSIPAKNQGGGDDVTGLRPFLSGDMPSRIDWRIFARNGQMMVRTLEGGAEEIILTWEDTAFLSDVEDRLQQLSRWIDDCHSAGLAFRLELGANISFSRNQIDQCRRALALFGIESRSA